MDARQFIQLRQKGWRRLETLLARVESRGFRVLDHAEARQLAALYRQASSDLIEARSRVGSYEIEQYLNDLVGRAYGLIYEGRQLGFWSGLWKYASREMPGLFRKHARYVALAAGLMFAGGLFAIVAMAIDPDAADYLVPSEFDSGDHLRDPVARRLAAEASATVDGTDTQALWSSALFTRNSGVAFLCFAFGICFGVPTALLLFYNGVILGAFAASYVRAGEGLFFFAWVLPHGVPEILSICIAGGAGLLLGRAMIAPGRMTRQESLRAHGREAVLLVLGTVPLLLYSGLIEGTISQIHEPVVPYLLKIALGGLEFLVLASYFLVAGRGPESTTSSSGAAQVPSNSIPEPA